MDYMEVALNEARIAYENGEAPVGAVLVKDNRIIAKAHNQREEKNDISSHAEIEVLRLGAKSLGSWSLDDCKLYVSLEPCLMCAGAIIQARIGTLIYGADNLEDGAQSKYGVFSHEKLLVYRGEHKEEAEKLLKDFFHSLRKQKSL